MLDHKRFVDLGLDDIARKFGEDAVQRGRGREGDEREQNE